MFVCHDEKGRKVLLRHAVADALVVNDQNEILLIKRSPTSVRPNKYAIPGGHLDRDETVIEGVLRELKEETGYDGEVVSLFCINDNWSEEYRSDDRQNIAFIFAVKILSGKDMINSEVSEITWFKEESLPPEDEFAFDHRPIIKAYFRYLYDPFPLPLFAKDIFK
jgi:mutator protein MutT